MEKRAARHPPMLAIMRIAGVTIGVLAALAGAVWVAQGLNLPLAPRSFMTADRTWFVIGVVTAAGGVALAAWSWRHA
jgi:glutamate dehydrogenase/leucine dehydrogenase